MSARDFDISDVLSITTGRLVSRRLIDGVYDILSWMTGEFLFTHQLPRACDACTGPLLEQHPGLADIDVPEVLDTRELIEAWLTKVEAQHGKVLSVEPLATWESINPLTELIDKIGPDRVIVVTGAPAVASDGAS